MCKNTYIFLCFGCNCCVFFSVLEVFRPFFSVSRYLFFTTRTIPELLHQFLNSRKKFKPEILWCALNTFNSHCLQNTELFIFCEPVHWPRTPCTKTNLFHNFLILITSCFFSHTFMLSVLLSRVSLA